MTLREWQTALGTLVVAGASGARPSSCQFEALTGLRLTAAEHAWLAQVVDTPGFVITCDVQRWWRETRLQWTARLTLAAVGPDTGEQLLKAYIETVPCASLFFLPEAMGFLDFLTHTVPMRPHLETVVQFERALLLAAAAAPLPLSTTQDVTEFLPSRQLHCHPAAALVTFAAPPETLLGALIQGTPLPVPSREIFPILVAPGLPHLWRPATADEARVFARCQPSARVDDLLACVHGDAQPLQHLCSVGALS